MGDPNPPPDRVLTARAGLFAWLLLTAAATAGCLGPSTEAAPPVRVTVVNYNIMHGLYDEDPLAPDWDRFEDRLLLLAETLSDLKPDILVLQEVILSNPPAGYPDVQATLLSALGGEYKAVFAESGTNRLNQGTFGRMTLTRLPVVSSVNRMVYQGRSAHRVTVRTKGGVLDIYNVHLEGPEFGGQQDLEASRLLLFIDAREGRNQNPVILAGDFNSRPADSVIELVRRAGFEDAMVAAGRDVTCANLGDPGCTRAIFPMLVDNPKTFQNIRIDYMFGRSGSELEMRVIDSKAFMDAPLKDDSGHLLWTSDHIGIQTTYELTRRPTIQGP